MSFYDVDKASAINELMERCAQAMVDDTNCFFSSQGANGDCNPYEAAGALNEVADILGIPGPSYIADKLYEQEDDKT